MMYVLVFVLGTAFGIFSLGAFAYLFFHDYGVPRR